MTRRHCCGRHEKNHPVRNAILGACAWCARDHDDRPATILQAVVWLLGFFALFVFASCAGGAR